jgi:RNA polymerase sigma-70 factor (ECF subfamily)
MLQSFRDLSSACFDHRAAPSEIYKVHAPTTTIFDRLHEVGRNTWPGVQVSAADFADHLALHLGLSSEAAESLATRAGDLYLALAAGRGDLAAISLVDRTCIAQVDAALHGMLSSSEIDDLKQQLRHRRFVGTNGSPKILDYAGRGELRAWVRASAVRAAISVLRSRKREHVHQQDLWIAAPKLGVDPTIDYLRPRLQAEFRAAFETALGSLETRERNLLKHHFLDGLSTDELAVLYRVHRATAFRWLARARERLLAQTRQALAARMSLRRSELDSVMRLIGSQLEVSMVRLFGADDPHAPEFHEPG